MGECFNAGRAQEITMKITVRQTGSHIRWERTERGWSCSFLTSTGRKTINTLTHDKRVAVKMAQKAKLVEKQAIRFDRKCIAAFLGIKNISNATCLEEWAETCGRNHTVQPRTIKHYSTYLLAFFRVFSLGKEPPSAITDANVSAFVNGNDGSKASTRNVRLNALKAYCSYCEAKGYAIGNPARVIGKVNMATLGFEQKETKHKTPFSDEEIDKLISYLDKVIADEQAFMAGTNPSAGQGKVGYCRLKRIRVHQFWRAAVVISRWTALRLGDVASLEWRQFENAGVIICFMDKTDKRIEVPTTPEILEAMDSTARRDARCFPEQFAINSSEHRSMLPSQFREILQRAGIDGRSFHSLRSSAAVGFKERLIAAGKSEAEADKIVSVMLGHGDVGTTKEFYLRKKE